jgi:hypothetical protein
MENTKRAPDCRAMDAAWRMWKAIGALDAAASLVAGGGPIADADGLSLLLGILAGELRGGLQQLEAASKED